MKMNLAFSILFMVLIATLPGSAQSVVNSVHNLSASGPGTIRATAESEICIFCHTPHNTRPVSPLWNRDDPGLSYTLYNSSTIQAAPGQPDGSSILCLSCHDGTIALGNVLSRTSDIDFSGGVSVMPPGNANLSKDLMDDHPVSFIYKSALASADGQIRDPSSILPPVRLEEQKMQCTSCHDPHNNYNTKFLHVSNQYSDLCYRCHDRNYWTASSHSTSTASWNNTAPNPWPHTPYLTVAENACENCHTPHNAGGKPRLMNYLAEERNCLSCHNGNVAGTNIEAQLSKAYTHNVYNYTAVHDASEDEIVLTRHVECEDCHNPHAVRSLSASPPQVNGFNEGVMGVDQNGNPINPVQYQYEICYRCHAESPDKPGSHTTRQVEQSNVRLEFDLNNPAFHPIEGPGKNLNVPSLISPDYSESSVMYCTDCHASDGSAPGGPHGSVFPAILKYRYTTADNTMESYSNYELCYRCHDRNSILNDESFAYHERHIREETTPCNACHDPHGISNTQGTSTNHAHLINFDLNIVFPDNNGRFRFEDTGTFSGRCYLRCHSRNHPGWGY